MGFFKRGGTVEGLASSGDVAEDGEGLKDVAFGGLEEGNFAEGMLGEILFGVEVFVVDVLFDEWDFEELCGDDNLCGTGVGRGGKEGQGHC